MDADILQPDTPCLSPIHMYMCLSVHRHMLPYVPLASSYLYLYINATLPAAVFETPRFCLLFCASNRSHHLLKCFVDNRQYGYP